MNAPLTKEQWQEVRRQSEAAVLNTVGLPDVLLPYQQEALRLLDSVAVPVLFIEKSRRVGLTWGLGSYAALRAGRSREAGGMDVMYISYSQEMTREFIDACAMWARAFSGAALSVDEFLFDDSDADGDRSIQAFRIRFASGFEILALSSAPRTLRGKQGVIIIDEAAFVDNLKELLKAAMAFLMWGGQVVVCSTHDGVENVFNVEIQNILGGRSKFAHMRIDLDQALMDGLYKRICLVKDKEWSPEAEADWRQDLVDFYGDGADEELFCIPSKGSGTWLSAPLIEARMTLTNDEAPIIRIELPDDFLQRTKLERDHLLAPHIEAIRTALSTLDPASRHSFGYDPARLADPAIIQLLKTDQTLNRIAALTVEMRRVPFEEQKTIARMILDLAPRLTGAAIDATGMGMNLAEDIGRELGLREAEGSSGLVWAIKLTSKWYNENFPPLKTAFEDNAIALARDDEHSADLRLVKVIRGIPSIPDERSGVAGKKRHGDFAVALALAYFAARMQWHEYDYRPLDKSQSSECSMYAHDNDRPSGQFRLAQTRNTRGLY